MTVRHELGAIGGVYVRQNWLEKAGEEDPGHEHEVDHATLLMRGRVRLEVDGFEPTVWEGPVFIPIKKQFRHKFIAETDDVLWYCIFAFRDENGEVTEIFNGDITPYQAVRAP